ncbi:hypothetical protein ACWESM_26235 [Nocardia sp. NPDC003999]
MNEHQPERCVRHRKPGWQRASVRTGPLRRQLCVRRTGDTA